MRADLRALLQHADADLAVLLCAKLLQPDRGRQPSRPGAHDHHVVIHAFARDGGGLWSLFVHGRSHGDSVLFLYLSAVPPAYNAAMQTKNALETLNWLVEAGADEAVGETPV